MAQNPFSSRVEDGNGPRLVRPGFIIGRFIICSRRYKEKEKTNAFSFLNSNHL